jgi:hypothetical protein
MTETQSSSEVGVLVATPSLHGDARTACLDLLEDDTENVLAVTYDNSPESFLDTWTRSVGTRPANVGIVDVGQTMRSTAAQSGGDHAANVVRTVPSPDDTTRVADAMASFLDQWPTTDETLVVFDSLTALLEHVALDTAVTFLDGLLDRLAETNAVGHFYLETRAHGDPTMATLCSMLDVGVEVVEDGDDWTTHRVERQTSSLPLDVLFDVLRIEQRRHVLRHLLTEDGPVSVETLATVVARRDGDGSEPTRNRQRRYYSSLYQLHLPKLADAGLVERDEDAGTVWLGDRAWCIEPFLALARE